MTKILSQIGIHKGDLWIKVVVNSKEEIALGVVDWTSWHPAKQCSPFLHLTPPLSPDIVLDLRKLSPQSGKVTTRQLLASVSLSIPPWKRGLLYQEILKLATIMSDCATVRALNQAPRPLHLAEAWTTCWSVYQDETRGQWISWTTEWGEVVSAKFSVPRRFRNEHRTGKQATSEKDVLCCVKLRHVFTFFSAKF